MREMSMSWWLRIFVAKIKYKLSIQEKERLAYRANVVVVVDR